MRFALGNGNPSANLNKLSITQAQQDRLLTLMCNRAPERRMKWQKAQKSLQVLQQLAKADRYHKQ